jgi:Fe2+ transport system protein FeoA
MFVYQRHVVPITRLMALGFARGVVMEIVKGNKMN